MADRRFDGLFETLEATFEAAIAAEDRSAAEDLALSLRHDRSIRDVLQRGGWEMRRPGELPERVAAVGLDYIETERGHLVPIDGVSAFEVDSAPAEERDETLLQILRASARFGAKVQIELHNATVEGQLLVAGQDHLLVETRHGKALVPLDAVLRISRRHGSSKGAS